jgi:DNA-binding response OmpR family regulator
VAGDGHGKIMIMTFDDSEEDVLKRILSVVDTEKDTFNLLETSKSNLIFQGLKIDENHRVIIKDNREIELTYIEFEVLLLLARHPGMVFSKEQIYDSVWHEFYSGDYNIVMSHIHNLREKIEDNPSKPVYIQTVWGVGYRFNKNLSSGL